MDFSRAPQSVAPKVQRRAVSNAAVPGEAHSRILRGAAFFLANRQRPLPSGNFTQTGISDEQIEYPMDRGMES